MSDIVKTDTNVPAFLQPRQNSFGNIDQSDQIVPRVKLLQGISPEIEAYADAKNGYFWHTLASEVIGNDVAVIPILVRKTYVLWAPRNDSRGILARAMDGKTWDVRDVFTVRPKGSNRDLIWDTTSGTVAQSGLDMFGTSNPDNPKSAPAASLTYNFLMYFPDFPRHSPAIVLNTRSAVKPAMDLIGKIQYSPYESYAQRYRMTVAKAQGDEGPYNNYRYMSDGLVTDEEVYNRCQELYHRFRDVMFRASDESEERSESGATSSKF